MADITLKGLQIPFVLGERAELSVHTQTAPLDKPIPDTVDVVLSVETGVSAKKPLALGGPGSRTMSLKTEGGIELRPVRARHTEIIRRYGLGPYFGGCTDGLVMLLTVGAQATAKFSGQFRYRRSRRPRPSTPANSASHTRAHTRRTRRSTISCGSCSTTCGCRLP